MTREPLAPNTLPHKESAQARAVWRGTSSFARRIALSVICLLTFHTAAARGAQDGQASLTPLQLAIKSQTDRLSSSDVEERRDALMKLGAMARPEASRAASAALGDRDAIIRITAAHAVLSLNPAEAAALIIPLLRDRDEFVRREAAYALGRTQSTSAVQPLVASLETDSAAAVRGAAAVALGQIADPSSMSALANSLTRRFPAPGFASRGARRRAETDEFVRRSAAVALGEIGSREAVPSLIAALNDQNNADDIRREAALALGRIGDASAAPALRAAIGSRDPHLSRAAFEALRKLRPTE